MYFLRSDKLWFINILCANKFAILCSVDILCLFKCVTETVEVTKGCNLAGLDCVLGVICVQYVYNMYTICVQYVYNMCTICVQYVYNMCTICVQYVYNVYNMCKICVQYVYNMCTICVQYVYNMCKICMHVKRFEGRDRPVGITTRYGLDGPGIEFWWGRDFPHLSRPAPGPTKPPVQWVAVPSRG